MTYWLIEWAKRRVISYESAMSDAYEVRETAFPLLWVMRSLENGFLWRDAAKAYEEARPKMATNPLY